MYGFARDPRDSTVFITDWIGLRKVTPDGTVTTDVSAGLVDQHGTPRGHLDPIAIGTDGSMYAAVQGSILTIRRI